MIPNPVIIAFDQRVRFEPLMENSDMGHLVIPYSEDANFEKPGFIVDGQQRTAALREADINSFMMPVSAFIANDAEEQREQFMLVNSTKPLPKRCCTNWPRIRMAACLPICNCENSLHF